MTTQQLAGNSLYNVFLEESSARVHALKWLHTFYVTIPILCQQKDLFGGLTKGWVQKIANLAAFQYHIYCCEIKWQIAFCT